MENIVYLMDCMEFLKTCPDKAFDLAIVDPPYGDGNQDIGGGYGSDNGSRGTAVHRLNNFPKPGTRKKPRQREELPGFRTAPLLRKTEG